MKMIAALQEEGFQLRWKPFWQRIRTVSLRVQTSRVSFMNMDGSNPFPKPSTNTSAMAAAAMSDVLKYLPWKPCPLLKTGGIAILAHPLLYHLGVEQLQLLIDDLKAVGLDGIEAIYSTYTTGEEQLVKRIAKKTNCSSAAVLISMVKTNLP